MATKRKALGVLYCLRHTLKLVGSAMLELRYPNKDNILLDLPLRAAANKTKALLRRIPDFHLLAFDDGLYVFVHGDLHPSNISINEMQVEW